MFSGSVLFLVREVWKLSRMMILVAEHSNSYTMGIPYVSTPLDFGDFVLWYHLRFLNDLYLAHGAHKSFFRWPDRASKLSGPIGPAKIIMHAL